MSPTPPAVHVHSAFWPYQRLATFLTAAQVDRSFVLMAPGRGKFSISRKEPILARNSDFLRRGNFIFIEATGSPPWVGLISTISDPVHASTINIEVVDILALLDAKPTRSFNQTNVGAGSMFVQLMRSLNARGHSGLFLSNIRGIGPNVSLDLSGQTTLSALKEIVGASGYEWWPTIVADAAHLQVSLNFGPQSGLDLSSLVHLYFGTHFTQFTHILDVQGQRQSVTVYGGVGPIRDRVSLTRTAPGSPQVSELGTLVEPASALYNRTVDIPPSMRTEDIIFRPLSDSLSNLHGDSTRSLEHPYGSGERFQFTIGPKFSPWSKISPGDYIRVWFRSANLGVVDRKVRILGLQLDEEVGEMVATVETPLR